MGSDGKLGEVGEVCGNEKRGSMVWCGGIERK